MLPSNLGALVNGYSPYASFFYNTEGLPYFSVGMGNFGVQIAKTTGSLGGAAAPAAAAVPKGLPGLGGLLGGGAGAAAHLGSATSIGKLSVPATWAGAARRRHPMPRPYRSAASAPPRRPGDPETCSGGMPLAGMGSGAARGAGPRYGFRPDRDGPTTPRRIAVSDRPDVATRVRHPLRCRTPNLGSHHLFDSTRGRVGGGALRSRRGLYLRQLYLRPDFIWDGDFQPPVPPVAGPPGQRHEHARRSRPSMHSCR